MYNVNCIHITQRMTTFYEEWKDFLKKLFIATVHFKSLLKTKKIRY